MNKKEQLILIFVIFISLFGCDVNLNDYINSDSSFISDSRINNDIESSTECIDNDLDGYGEGCINGLDCDDSNVFINPDSNEYCDGIDNNCNGLVDENTLNGEDRPFKRPMPSKRNRDTIPVSS